MSIARWEEQRVEDADVAVVAYGITSRVAERAVQMARAEGIRGGPAAARGGMALPGEAHPSSWRKRCTPSWWWR